MRLRSCVDLVEEAGAVDGVWHHTGRLGKRPAVFPHEPVHDRERDHGLEPFELAEDERPVRPRACERDVEVIAARFCLEPSRSGRPRRAIRSDPVPERGGLAHEAPARAFGIVPLIEPDAVDKQSHRRSPNA